MKLNPDCIRDILLTLEEECGPNKYFSFPGNHPKLEKYSNDEVLYHINQCVESGLVTGFKRYIRDSLQIKDLSPAGHKFLADTRDQGNWALIKEKLNKTGSFSLKVMISVASGVITGILNQQLGI